MTIESAEAELGSATGRKIMARGRMLQNRISKSKKLSGLSSDTVRLLYTWMLSHLDVNGNFYADPVMVNNLVFTRLGHSAETINAALCELDEVGLIRIFEFKGEYYLNYPDFNEKQPKINKEREGKPDIPEFNQELLKSYSRPDQTQTKLREVKLIALSKDSAGENPPVPSKKLPLPGSKQNKHFNKNIPNVQQVEKLCLKIKEIGNGKFNAYQFVQKCTNEKQHPQAIFDALAGMIKMWPEIKNHYTYGMAIIKTKSQNYNESEHMKQAEAFKVDWGKEFFE